MLQPQITKLDTLGYSTGLYIFTQTDWGVLRKQKVFSAFLDASKRVVSNVNTLTCQLKRNCSVVLVHVTAGIVSSMTGKLFVATSSVVVTLFVGEMFPTLLRNTSIGISSMSSRLASAMAPFLIFAGMVFGKRRYADTQYQILLGYTWLNNFIFVLSRFEACDNCCRVGYQF